jgi:hypothetical protein
MAYIINNICVYCGSSAGTNPKYREGAIALGEAMVERNIGLVYGGGSVGLMGIIADSMMEMGGNVIGVIPEVLNRRERINDKITETHIVANMHERKAMMAERADGFIAMPGGFGTFEELMEAITWLQLGIHGKPVAVFNVAGFYDPLLEMIERAADHEFIRETNRQMLIVGDTPESILDQFAAFDPKQYLPPWEGLKP